MPMAKKRSGGLKPIGIKALFVVSLLLSNLVFSTVSSATAYAGTATENENELIVQVDGEEQQNQENTEQVPAFVELVSEEPAEVSPDVVVASTDLSASFGCWTRQGLTDFGFSVIVNTSVEEMFEQGSQFNDANPDKYESILPELFGSGNHEVVVTGWDGQPFVWQLGLSSLSIDRTETRCEGPTLADLIEDDQDLSMLNQLLQLESRDCLALHKLLSAPAEKHTLFMPTNAAITGLVSAPANSDNELNQLQANGDEACALIASHIVPGEYASNDFSAEGLQLPALDNDEDGIFVNRPHDSIFVNGIPVTEGDFFAVNGVLHKVNTVLLPQSVGTIDKIVTDKTSPALSGTINTLSLSEHDSPYEYCVLVRVNGVPYIAEVNGASWKINEGVISINPSHETLFDVVVRDGYGLYANGQGDMKGCEDIQTEYPEGTSTSSSALVEVVTHGGRLLGLTMSKSVVSMPTPATPVDSGEVLGETTDNPEPKEVAIVSTSTPSCGKGICGDFVAQADDDPSMRDSDGDGVVDSEDPAPFDPNITGQEESGNGDQDVGVDSESNDDNSSVLLWFLLGGGAVVVWYLLWQRSGRES